jgi:hypothetical protein
MAKSRDPRAHGRFDELAEEFSERYRRGERPSLQAYVDRMPEMTEEIRVLFRAVVEVEEADGVARATGFSHRRRLPGTLVQRRGGRVANSPERASLPASRPMEEARQEPQPPGESRTASPAGR